jgi:hypothetical protein
MDDLVEQVHYLDVAQQTRRVAPGECKLGTRPPRRKKAPKPAKSATSNPV